MNERHEPGGPIQQNESPEPTLGLPIERADAMLPENLLRGDEVILLLIKPSLWYIVLACLGTLSLIVGAAVLLIMLHSLFEVGAFRPREVIAGAAVMIAIRLGWQCLEWYSRTYVLTDHRVIRIRGVIRVQIFEASLVQIQHTELLLSLRERVCRLGTIAFATAGSAFPEAYWLMVHRPLAVHRRILQAIHKAQRSSGGG
ncbi:MAG: hypothetical protein CMJ49_02830 [Planctomycetaceae bacterium]|nr:hypothetical protein [Planctomycetaceae bacterium]